MLRSEAKAIYPEFENLPVEGLNLGVIYDS